MNIKALIISLLLIALTTQYDAQLAKKLAYFSGAAISTEA